MESTFKNIHESINFSEKKKTIIKSLLSSAASFNVTFVEKNCTDPIENFAKRNYSSMRDLIQ